MKERVERKVENAESARLPLAYRLQRMQGSYWLTECRAPIGLQIAENAGLPLAHRMRRAPIGLRSAESAGLPWFTECGECRALQLCVWSPNEI
jgi:hypothetical protein